MINSFQGYKNKYKGLKGNGKQVKTMRLNAQQGDN